jgi:hypothetical protein
MAYTIKRQNLSGDWFETKADKHEDATILFQFYCDGPFQTVEFWQEGTTWHTVYDKKLDKFFDCQEISYK